MELPSVASAASADAPPPGDADVGTKVPQVDMQQLIPGDVATELIHEQIARLLSMVTSARADGAATDTVWMKAALKQIEDLRAWRNSLRDQHVLSSELFTTLRGICSFSREGTKAGG